MNTTDQPGADTKITLESHVQGRGLLFEVDGGCYILRPPTPAERDEASRIEQIEKRWIRMTDEKIKQLAEMEPPTEEIELYRLVVKFEENVMRAAEENGDDDVEELERRISAMYSNLQSKTAADVIIIKHGRQCRSRYLAKTLLCDGSMQPLAFDEQEIAVQERATEGAEELWDSIEQLPFLSEQLQS